MTDPALLCQNLQTLWHENFPMTRAMDVHVDSYADHTLVTRTPLTPNTNIHNTAFAGSLYAIESLTAWGLLHLELQVAGFDASIIHASGSINFTQTVTEDIVARSNFTGHENIFDQLRTTGKARLTLSAEVFAGSVGSSEAPASTFEGLYVVRLND